MNASMCGDGAAARSVAALQRRRMPPAVIGIDQERPCTGSGRAGRGRAGAVAVGRALWSLLFGVTAHDPVSLAVVTVTLALAAAIASYLPARRAGHVDPVIALRAE